VSDKYFYSKRSQHWKCHPIQDWIEEATFYNWKKMFGGLGPSEVRRLKQLGEENRRLKQMVADLSLDKQMLQDILSRKL